MNIAVIDDGINEELYTTGPLRHNIEITPELVLAERKPYNRCKPSHGTTCAAIIKKYAPEARLSSVKILNDRSKKAEPGQLVKALEWCAENDVKIINLSLGSIAYKDFDRIRECVNRVCNKGVIIIAACNNRDIISYPACLSNVVGVKCDRSSRLRGEQYLYNFYPYDGIEVTACGSHRLVDSAGNTVWGNPANSFAAPVVTALINNILLKNPQAGINEIKKELSKGSINPSNPEYNPYFCRNIDWIEKAIAFEIGIDKSSPREMDYKFPIGKTVRIKCEDVYSGLCYIKDYVTLEKESMKEYDTVLLLPDPGLGPAGKDEAQMLSSIMEASGKSMAYVSNSYKEGSYNLFNRCIQSQIWHPAVYSLFRHECAADKEIAVPLILIYDFTGKEAVNLSKGLADRFIKDGYNCAAASDEYTGVAVGLEYIPSEGCETASGIALMHRFYKPDVMLYGVSAAASGGCPYEALKSIGIDLNIFIVDQWDESIVYQIEEYAGQEAPFVLCTNSMEDIPKMKAKSFDSADINMVYKLYRYIIRLFKAGETTRNEKEGLTVSCG